MKRNKEQIILKLAQKKLKVIDVLTLYKMLLECPCDDITLTKIFLDNYYNVQWMPIEFYKMFLYCIHTNKCKNLFRVLITKNIYELISFLKYDNERMFDIKDSIDPINFFELSVKHVKTIKGFIKKLDLCNNEISLKKYLSTNAQWLLRKTSVNTEEEFTKIALKMYLTIGLDNAIELLTCKYGLVDYEMIYYLFNSINTLKMNYKEVNIFQEFLFNNKKDSNNNMRLMLNGNFIELFINFDYFFNNIRYFINKMGTKFNRNTVSLLFEDRYLVKKTESPELSRDILEDMISSYYHKYGISDTEAEIINRNLKAYNEKLKTKTKTSILKTDIPQIGDYSFEMIPLSDVRNLVIGYRAGNCFRINGDAFILFDKFLTNPHMRIMSISTDEYKDFGMVLLMRNGNVLIAQGIEISKRVPKQITGENLYNAVVKAIEYVMNNINKEDDEIIASIIGLSNDNTIPYNHNILPFIVNPILDDNHQYYNGINCYQGLLRIKENKRIQDIKLYVPEKLYNEKSNYFLRRDYTTKRNSMTYSEIEKILISLRYERFKNTSVEESISYYSDLPDKKEKYTICSLDWFITAFHDGTFDSYIKSNDSEIIEDYRLELDKVKRLNRTRE